MDPVEAVNVETDTGFMLAHTAQERGHELWIYQPHQLSLEDGRVSARARRARLQAAPGDPARLEAPAIIDLAEMDVVLMRQDPPFDMAYVDATHILEHVHPRTLVVNDPVEVRNAPEKLFVTRFRGLQPPTLISRDEEAIADFHARHRDIVVKPLNAAGGSGVLRLKEGDANLGALLELHFEMSREPVVAQAFIPGVAEGDKRILLVDGEAVGAINRVPKAGQVRSNLRVGGTAQPVELTERDREICAAIGPELKRRGLMFVGIDVIAGWLTEINVTAPTGAQQLKRFGGADAAALLWDRIEAIRGGR